MVAAGLFACAVMAAAPALAGDPPTRYRVAAGADGSRLPVHTSDNQPGWIAPPVTGLGRRTVTKAVTQHWRVSPGVTYTRWYQWDARGVVRAHLLRVDPRTPGLRLDYASAGPVTDVATVPSILRRDRAIAGVNGDFYDIGRTGAPLGLGVDRQRGLLHGRSTGWNNAFYLDRHGRPAIGDLPLTVRVRQHPEIAVTGLNSPYVEPGQVGLYTRAWGRPSSLLMTHGQRTDVRFVWVEKGTVVRVRKAWTRPFPVTGSLLVGRGAGAEQLRALKPGMPARFALRLAERPRVAISGDRRLVEDGVVTVRDDREMHPRTAIGVDRDTGQVLVLVVDGRWEHSRGSTMVELANLMLSLGAEDAVNLDGGGSSTMVAARHRVRPRVVNRPSDGFERRVANALELTYTRPGR